MSITIQLGSSLGGKNIFWNAEMNYHQYISGISGSGKSNYLKHVTLQLPCAGVRAVVFDHAGDLAPCIAHYARRMGLSYEPFEVRSMGIDPFRRIRIDESGEEESTYVAASRVADAVIATYHIRGDKQKVLLRRAIMEYMERDAAHLSFAGLVDYIEEDDKLASKMASALLCLKDICELLPPRCGDYRWELGTPGISLISFATLQNESAQSLAIQSLIFELWSLKVNAGKDGCPVVIVCDECQRLDFSRDSINVRLLREGRKHNLFGWYASQFITNDIALNALDQVGFRAYFFPGARQARPLAKQIFCDSQEEKECAELIRNLSVGQFIYLDKEGRPIVCCVPNVSDYNNEF